MKRKVYVCRNCGSKEVFCDAHVNLNDENDVRTYDSTDCFGCGQTDVRVEEKEEDVADEVSAFLAAERANWDEREGT